QAYTRSLDASGGSVFLNLLGAAEGALIRAAASTQPLGGTRLIRDDSQSASELMTQRNPIMTTRTRILAGAATALVVGYVLGYYFGGGVHTSQHQVLTSRELTCLSTYA